MPNTTTIPTRKFHELPTEERLALLEERVRFLEAVIGTNFAPRPWPPPPSTPYYPTGPVWV